MLDIQSGRCSRTTVVVPAADRQPDDGRDVTEIRQDVGGPTDIFARRVIVSSGRKFLEEMDEDVGFSFVTVSFEVDGDWPQPTTLDANAQGRLIDEALDFVGEFASVYRLVSGQVDVFAPTMFDTPVVRVALARSYSFTDTTVSGVFTRISRKFLLPPDARSGVAKARLSEAQFQELTRRLRSGEGLHISDALFMEVKELREMHRDFRLALVVGGTGFETWLQWRVLEEFRLRGITHHPPGAAEALADVIPERNVMPIFRDYIAHLVGRDVRMESVYTQWRTDAYLPRNEVVHRGRMNVTDADVVKAMVTIQTLRMFLDTELKRTRPP